MIRPEVKNDIRFCQIRLDTKVYRALDLLGVDQETRTNYFESLSLLNNGEVVKEKLAIIRTAIEEAGRMEAYRYCLTSKNSRIRK